MSEDIAQSGPEMILEANVVSEPGQPSLEAEKVDFWNQPEKTCSEGQLVLQRMCSREQNLPPMCTTQQTCHTRTRSWKNVLLGRGVKPGELVLDRPHMMVKKRMSSNDLVFRFEIPGSPRTAGTAPNSPRAPLSPADSPNSVFLSSEAENGVEEKKRLSRSPTIQSPTLSSEAESPDQRKIICLRSKSTSSENACLVREKNDCKTEDKNDSKMDRKKSSSSSSQYKANMHFHKLFLDVPTEEPLQQSFTCALQKEILYQGKLFVSENWICFHSKVFGKDTKIAIPTFSVTQLKKTKTALLVPNALVITTVTDRYIFVSLLSRDSTYKLIKSVCSHLENTSVANSPNPSSLENSFRADRPSSLPLDFNDEFSDLDGVVRQRRKHMEGYSSSGSQTPESENSRDFLVAESQAALNVSKGEVKPARVDAHVNRVPEGKAKSLPAHGQPETTGILHKVKPQKCLSLHHILIFYAVVVCVLIISTFYMRYRINTLEDRLGSLTTNVDTHPNEQTAPSGLGSQVQLNVEVLCQELTANIMKLEKIQNNLQKLLENGD